jgi:hypothetical protein
MNKKISDTFFIRITPAWKQELEHIKAEHASRGSIASVSEIVRQSMETAEPTEGA